MNEKTSPTLTAYQQATLGEIGIVTWQLQSAKPLGTAAAHYEPNTHRLTHNTDVDSDTLLPASSVAKAPSPIPESIKQFKSQELNTAVKKSVPNSLIFGFDVRSVKGSLVNDILLSVGYPQDKFDKVVNVDCEQYADYAFSWKIGKEVSFQSRLLVTPPIDTLLSPAIKKQLWSVISNIAND